jgi:hypothetical protein
MKRLLAAFFVITVLISNAYSIYATEGNDTITNGSLVDLKFKEHCGELFKMQDRMPDYSYVTYEKDGKEFPVYCLNNDLQGVYEGCEYPVRITGKIEDELAWKVIVNGYPYKTPEELGVANKIEAFVATKLAVNMALNEDYPDDKYTALDTDESRRVIAAYKTLLENAKKSDLKMENDLTSSIVPEEDEWIQDVVDPKCVSKTYRVDTKVQNGEYSIELPSVRCPGHLGFEIYEGDKLIGFTYDREFIDTNNYENDYVPKYSIIAYDRLLMTSKPSESRSP